LWNYLALLSVILVVAGLVGNWWMRVHPAHSLAPAPQAEQTQSQSGEGETGDEGDVKGKPNIITQLKAMKATAVKVQDGTGTAVSAVERLSHVLSWEDQRISFLASLFIAASALALALSLALLGPRLVFLALGFIAMPPKLRHLRGDLTPVEDIFDYLIARAPNALDVALRRHAKLISTIAPPPPAPPPLAVETTDTPEETDASSVPPLSDEPDSATHTLPAEPVTKQDKPTTGGEVGGLGLVLRRRDGEFFVEAVQPGSSAEGTIEVGDCVEEVGGVTLAGMASVAHLIRGPVDSSVVVSVRTRAATRTKVLVASRHTLTRHGRTRTDTRTDTDTHNARTVEMFPGEGVQQYGFRWQP